MLSLHVLMCVGPERTNTPGFTASQEVLGAPSSAGVRETRIDEASTVLPQLRRVDEEASSGRSLLAFADCLLTD